MCGSCYIWSLKIVVAYWNFCRLLNLCFLLIFSLKKLQLNTSQRNGPLDLRQTQLYYTSASSQFNFEGPSLYCVWFVESCQTSPNNREKKRDFGIVKKIFVYDTTWRVWPVVQKTCTQPPIPDLYEPWVHNKSQYSRTTQVSCQLTFAT